MTRSRKDRRIHILQDSPFLNLPAEIREQIYYAALVRPTPIDLWPLKYMQGASNSRVFRLQEDLQFVRREMGTGLLATCKQVFHEAGKIFWSKNTFRFSGDIEWFGARRFLGQIGPRALSQLQSLELFAPLFDAHCLETSLFDGGDVSKRIEFYTNAREAKNMPKMHMAKARKEPWIGNHRHWGGRWVLENTIFVLTRNVEHVCYLLDQAKASLDLKLILPQGFGLNSVHGPLYGPYGPYGRSMRMQWGPWGGGPHQIVPQPNDLRLPKELLRILPLFARGVTLVIEAGAYLHSLEMPEQFTNKGINVLCQPGSFLLPGSSQSATEILEVKRWMDPSAGFDYLVGVSALFDELQEVSVAARSGKTTTAPGPKSTERILKGFGGCRFVQQDVWDCCPWGPGPCKHRARRWKGGKYDQGQSVRKCSVKKVLVIKKRGRAIRNGVVGDGR
jgi:hypothetical protein